MSSRFFNFNNDPFFGGHSERMRNSGIGQPIIGDDLTFPSLWGFEPVGGRADENTRRGALNDRQAIQEPSVREGALGATGPRDHARSEARSSHEMTPFGFRDPFSSMFGHMGSMMSQMVGMSRDANNMMGSMSREGMDGTVYNQSSVYSYRDTGEGKPDVYEVHRSEMTGPGGIREEKKALRDSGRDLEKMSVGRHIKDRGHVIEKTRNTRSNETSQHEELRGLHDGEVSAFKDEWKERTSGFGRLPGRERHLPGRERHLELEEGRRARGDPKQ